MAKGVELTDDQLEAFAGGGDLVVVNGGLDHARIIDLSDGRVIYDSFYENDVLKWAKARMQSGEKIYRMPTLIYNKWRSSTRKKGKGATWGWKGCWDKYVVDRNDIVYIEP